MIDTLTLGIAERNGLFVTHSLHTLRLTPAKDMDDQLVQHTVHWACELQAPLVIILNQECMHVHAISGQFKRASKGMLRSTLAEESYRLLRSFRDKIIAENPRATVIVDPAEGDKPFESCLVISGNLFMLWYS